VEACVQIVVNKSPNQGICLNKETPDLTALPSMTSQEVIPTLKVHNTF